MSILPTTDTVAKLARPRLVFSLVGALLMLALAASASASTVLKLDLQSLVANSDQIVDGEVVSVQSKVEQGKVYTYTEIKVVDGLKGVATDKTVTIKHIGGRTDELSTWVPGVPHFQDGERVVVFLEKPKVDAQPVVTGMSQGKFQIALGPDNATKYVVPHLGDLALIEPLDPNLDDAVGAGEASRQAAQQQNGEYQPAKPADLYERVVPLDVFKQQVRDVIRDQGD